MGGANGGFLDALNWLVVATTAKYQIAGNLLGIAKPIIDTIGFFGTFIGFAIDIIDLIQKCASSDFYLLAVLTYTVAIIATTFLLAGLGGFFLPLILGLMINVAMDTFKNMLTNLFCRYTPKRLLNITRFV